MSVELVASLEIKRGEFELLILVVSILCLINMMQINACLVQEILCQCWV